jgi:hypothetical protein
VPGFVSTWTFYEGFFIAGSLGRTAQGKATKPFLVRMFGALRYGALTTA